MTQPKKPISKGNKFDIIGGKANDVFEQCIKRRLYFPFALKKIKDDKHIDKLNKKNHYMKNI